MVKPRILIDAIPMSHPQPGGYKTYTSNLVESLSEIDGTAEYVLAVDRRVDYQPKPGWRVAVLGRTGSLGVVWREQVDLVLLARREQAMLIHSPAATAPWRTPMPLILTVYDVMEFTDPLPSLRKPKRWAMRVYSRLSQSNAAKRASHILTVSHYSRSRIQHRFGIPDERITVTYPAHSRIYKQLDHAAAANAVAERFGAKDYVLGIASSARRKNAQGLVAAFAVLPPRIRQEHPLLLTCTHRGMRQQLEQLAISLGLEGQVSFAEGVTDEELALLYNAAAVFVFPSLEEGFGLPPLEAMACGAPVVSSNSSSLPEVVGDAGIMVCPTDTVALSAAIAEVLSDPVLAGSLRERGMLQAARFSWNTTAAETAAVYRRVLHECA